MSLFQHNLAVAALTSLALFSGCSASVEDDHALNEQRQAAVDAENGLRTINGLSTRNGLNVINGLSTRNGLRTINGISTINGLRTINGVRTINGASVDCTDKTAGVDCTGEPDGLLSASTGLMATDDGITTAQYLVRCALPDDQSIRIKDYTGALVTLPGEIGFAPEWADGQCDTTCQEKVSACLMSLTNSSGNHVDVELTAQFTVGTDHDRDYPYQEAAFYGNVFVTPPQASFAVGKDYQGLNLIGINVGAVANRLCAAVTQLFGPNSCPYVLAGNANFSFTDPLGLTTNKCQFKNGAATKCKDKSGKWWSNPITTYRMDKGAQ